MEVDGEAFPVRVELVAVCGSDFQHLDNIVAECVTCIQSLGWFAQPGAIFPSVEKKYEASKTLDHVLLTTPFTYDDSLRLIELETKSVDWLLVVPISESEYQHAEEHGSEALIDLMVEAQPDITIQIECYTSNVGVEHISCFWLSSMRAFVDMQYNNGRIIAIRAKTHIAMTEFDVFHHDFLVKALVSLRPEGFAITVQHRITSSSFPGCCPQSCPRFKSLESRDKYTNVFAKNYFCELEMVLDRRTIFPGD